jgi:hypothetical protein
MPVAVPRLICSVRSILGDTPPGQPGGHRLHAPPAVTRPRGGQARKSVSGPGEEPVNSRRRRPDLEIYFGMPALLQMNLAARPRIITGRPTRQL